MPEEMKWKKFLTENVLGEYWGADQRPGGDLPNRPFNNQDDMMDLYKALRKSGRWDDFLVFLWPEYIDASKYLSNTNLKASRGALIAWLFCLGDEDYESRCKLVAEFCGWEEYK